MEIVKKNAKPIAIAAGVTAGILGLYLLYKRSSSKRFKTKFLTKQEKEEMINKIKVTESASLLSVDTVVQLLEAISTIAVSETLVSRFEFQKARRKHRKNFAKYIKICEENIYEDDATLTKWKKEILKRFGISEIFLQNSVHQYRYQNNQKINDILDKMKRDRGNQNESTKAVSLETFIIILKRLTELFEAEFAFVSTTKSMIKNPGNVFIIISFKVYDVIYDEFGLTDEDISAAISTHSLKIQTEYPEVTMRYDKILNSIQLSVADQPFF